MSGPIAGSARDRPSPGIEREIGAAKALLVLWSATSAEFDWVLNEARTGKERSGLIAVQLEPCQLPLEFRSIQAEILPEGAESGDNPVWLGVLARIGDLIGRPGLAEYAKLNRAGTLDDWKRWLARYAADPLASGVIDNIVERAMPDMRQQLAGERAKRTALEAELAEHVDASRTPESGEVATNARELVRLRRELDEARSGQRDAEAELARFPRGVGRQERRRGWRTCLRARHRAREPGRALCRRAAVDRGNLVLLGTAREADGRLWRARRRVLAGVRHRRADRACGDRLDQDPAQAEAPWREKP